MAKSNAQRQREYNERHPGRRQEQWRKYAATDKGRVSLLLNYAKDRARRNNLPFDLDREWLAERLQAGVCEFTGLPFQQVAPGDYRTHPYTPSIDKIVPKLGYVKENCRLVLFGINLGMSDWGEDIYLKMAQAALNKHVTG